VAELETARAEIPDPAAGTSTALTAALALAYVAAGRVHDTKELLEGVVDEGTYLDRLQMATADAFAKLQLGDPGTNDAFDALVAQADATESRLDQAIVHLARARARRALDRPDASDAEAEAQSRRAAMGLDLRGWDAVFTRAARGDRA
jgi:hypothetical protein